MNNIPKLNELIYAEVKLIDVPLRNPNRNTKPGGEIRLGRQVKNLRQQAKILSV